VNDKAVLRISDLTKEYGSLRAVAGVSFSVDPGQIVGLLGPNGAGKTTTINMILGILQPTGGSIKVLGKNLQKCRSEVSTSMNFAAVYAHMPANLTVWQNLYVFSLLYGIRNRKE
jgi:ABC-2 type transport system ATP-binding protein